MKKSIVELNELEMQNVTGRGDVNEKEVNSDKLTDMQKLGVTAGIVLAMAGVYFVVDPLINRIAGVR